MIVQFYCLPGSKGERVSLAQTVSDGSIVVLPNFADRDCFQVLGGHPARKPRENNNMLSRRKEERGNVAEAEPRILTFLCPMRCGSRCQTLRSHAVHQLAVKGFSAHFGQFHLAKRTIAMLSIFDYDITTGDTCQLNSADQRVNQNYSTTAKY
jgi:hypothetical protein